MNKLLLIFFAILLTPSPKVFSNTAKTGIRNITSMQLVSQMGIGWNLGNTFDAKGTDETAWNNPFTTKAMIDEVAKKGFKTIRIPVTWQFHKGNAPDYKIEKAWLNRVEEVANYAFQNDMYVIINIHHDDEWVVPSYKKLDETNDQLHKVWTQIANHFKDYGDYLILETLNEPRLVGSEKEWIGGTEEGRDCVNQMQKVCVDAIRATGGNNKKRHLLVSPYAANASPLVLNNFEIPNFDPRVIVSLHNYV